MSPALGKRLGAEAIGTFALVFAGTGAIVCDADSGGGVSHVGVGLTFGLIVMVMIYSLGEISGAHFNPAVTLGFWAAGRFPGRELAPYAGAQTLGALAASGLLRLLFPLDPTGLGATRPVGGAVGRAFVFEVFLTAVLMLVILRVSTGAKEKGITAGIAIGATVGLEALFAGPVCGASMNPARSLAPALMSGQPGGSWLYLLAPALGALLAVPLGRWLGGENGPSPVISPGPIPPG